MDAVYDEHEGSWGGAEALQRHVASCRRQRGVDWRVSLFFCARVRACVLRRSFWASSTSINVTSFTVT